MTVQWRPVPAVSAACLVAVPLGVLAWWVRSDWDPVHRLDHGVADGLHGWVAGRPAAIAALKVVDVALHPWVFRAMVLALAVVLARRGAGRLAWWAGLTMAAGSALGALLKLVFERARPAFDVPVGYAPGFSFPSGHALNSTVGILILLLAAGPVLRSRATRCAAWLGGAAVVLLVGFDRIALGVHYVSDVAAGWLVAVALVTAAAAALPPRSPAGLTRRVRGSVAR